MNVKLGRRAQPTPSDDPVDLLLACHTRIRDHLARAQQLVARELVAPDAQIAEAAAAVHRYFSVALPLHIADEEESLRPRLLASVPDDAELVAALAQMTDEHARIDDTLAALLPRFAAVAADPSRRQELVSQQDAVADVARALAAHLELEETRLFPVCAAWSPAIRAAVVAELRGRRS